MDEQNIIDYQGEAGISANIDLDIPLPGAHSGRRIIEITDIPEDAWSDQAQSEGTDWATHLGFERDVETFTLANPDKFIDYYFNELGKAAAYPGLVGQNKAVSATDMQLLLNSVRSATKISAENMRRDRGHLREWRGRLDGNDIRLPTSSGSSKQDVGSMAKLGDIDGGENQEASNNLEAAAEAVNNAFQETLTTVEEGTVLIPGTIWGGNATTVPINLEEEAQPRLFIIQVFGITSFLGNYGFGRTVKTISLAGGEEYRYSSRTWRATSETRMLSSSIIDSYDENSSQRFADTVLSETTDAATQEKSTNWYAEAEAKGSIGIASASVSGGGGGETTAGTEAFARAVDESVAEHANEASSHRENSVTSSSEFSEESGEETVIERTIKNMNLSRTLNYAFRELNSAYITKTHLKDIRLGYTNGQAGSWREVPLSKMATFVDELISDKKTARTVQRWILDYIGIVFDKNDIPQTALEKVSMGRCGTAIKSIEDAFPNEKCEWEAPPQNMSFYYRFKRGNPARSYAIGQSGEDYPVAGVLLREREVTLRTDSVVMEGLKGVNSLLDEYVSQEQAEAARALKLANDRDALALEIINSGDHAKADLYQLLFGQHVETEPIPEV